MRVAGIGPEPASVQHRSPTEREYSVKRTLFSFELIKLTGAKVIAGALAVALAVTAFLAFRQAKQTDESGLATAKTLTEVFRTYAENRAEIDSYEAELKQYQRTQRTVKKEAEAAGLEFTETRRSIWTDGLYTEDLKIITEIRKIDASRQKYPQEIATYVKNTEQNMAELLISGYTEDSFEYRFQQLAGEEYRAVADSVVLGPVYVSGWNDFYGFTPAAILSLFVAVMAGAAVFIREKETGTLLLTRTAKKGRARTALSKLASAALAGALSSAVITFAAFAVFAAKEGFYGGNEPIQALDTFRKSALLLSVRQYLPVFLASRALAAAAVAVFTAFISAVLYNYVLTFAAGAAFAGINVWLFLKSRQMIMGFSGYSMNLYTLAEGQRTFARYSAFNLFGFPAEYSVAVPVVCLLFIIAASAGAVIIYSRGSEGVRIPFAGRAAEIARKAAERLRSAFERAASFFGGGRHTSLFGHELYKSVFSTVIWVVALALCAGGGVLFSRSAAFTAKPGYSDKLFYLFVEEYSGPWTEEKHAEIKGRYDQAQETMNAYAKMKQHAETGRITSDEWFAYLREYNAARRDLPSYEKLFDYSEYLQKKAESTGLSVDFTDDRGWNAFFDRPFDYLGYAAIVIALAGVFSQEYGARSAVSVLRTTKKGRRETLAAKFGMTVAVSAVLTAVSELSAWIPLLRAFDFPGGASVAASIRLFSDMSSGISLSGAALVFSAVRFAAGILLGLVTVCASGLLRSLLPAAAAVAALTALPSVIAWCGYERMSAVDFMRLHSAGSALLASIAGDARPDLLLTSLVVAVLSVAAAAAVLMTGRRYCRRA